MPKKSRLAARAKVLRRKTKPAQNALLPSLLSEAINENWVAVDMHMSKVATMPNARLAFNQGIFHGNENARDFYFTLIEKAKIPENIFAKMRAQLFRKMAAESARYAKFRAACALANHGAKKYARLTYIVLEPYLHDPDVAVQEIARKYISKLSRETRS